MTAYRTLAPAKVNLGLFLGPRRGHDRRHELVTVMQAISLADDVCLSPAAAGAKDDELVCPGVSGAPHDNLAWAALKAFRAATGWDAPPLRVSVVKRIPVAGGLGGGSADAAGVLRLASYASGLGDEQLLRELGADLGADVPAQVSPGRWLAAGAGECLVELPDPSAPLGLLVLSSARQLSTAAVYGEADRLGLGHARDSLAQRRDALLAAFAAAPALPAATELLENDLQPAALSLCPQIADALIETSHAGADFALLSGSGPTVAGLFEPHARGAAHSRALATAALRGRVPAPIWATSVNRAFARVSRASGAALTSDTTVRHNLGATE